MQARFRTALEPAHFMDIYKRPVRRVRAATGQDVAAEMIRARLAGYTAEWAHEDEPADRERYRQLEAKTRASRVGLWGAPSPMPPWVCCKLPPSQCR